MMNTVVYITRYTDQKVKKDKKITKSEQYQDIFYTLIY